jgi:hypothetical protein
MEPTPPTSGSRIQHLGDRLVVEFRPVREPGAIGFLFLFLPLWTFGGIVVIRELILGHASWGERPFLLFWLCGWAAAEGMVVVSLAWLLWGRELLIVTPDQFEVRQRIGHFARTKLYDAPLVQTVEAARVPYDEEEGLDRRDFCLRFVNEDKSVDVGEGMTEQEAEDVAAAVRELIRPRRWWGEEVDQEWNFPQLCRAAAAKRSRAPLVWAVAFCAFVAATVIGFVFDRHSGEQRTARPLRPARGPDVYLVYASGVAHQTLLAAGAIPLERPACTGDARTQHWVCRAHARSPAGVTLLYRCESSLARQHLDEPVLCAPRPPV